MVLLKNVTFLAILVLLPSSLIAASFNELVKSIDKHSGVQQKRFESLSLKELSYSKGSWGDPVFKISAMNYPKNSLTDDRTPMTGIQYSLSQKMSFTGKYGKIRNWQQKLSEIQGLKSEDFKFNLKKDLWIIAIAQNKSIQEIDIYKDNLKWTDQILAVSKKLYSNGKIDSQDLLDIQIRKEQIESHIIEREHHLKELQAQLKYIVSSEQAIFLNITTVPWKILSSYQKTNNGQDYKEVILEKRIEANNLKYSAEKLSFVPDITMGISYTSRANIDGQGDFVGAFVSFPLPFSSKKYGSYKSAVFNKMAAERSHRDYIKLKKAKLEELLAIISKLDSQLNILKNKIIKFAQSSRDITFRAFKHGKVSYLKLLSAEMQLQNILLQTSTLEAKLKVAQLEYLFIKGSKLD